MAAKEHVGQSSVMQPPLSSPMGPPHEYGTQGRGPRHLTPDGALEKQNADGETAGGKQEEQAVAWQDELCRPSSQAGVEDGQAEKDPGTVFDPVEYWQAVNENVMSALAEAMKKGQQEWQQLHTKEQHCLTRLQELYKGAHNMNVGFHNQLDSLHTTVLGLVSSFKK